MPQISRRLHSHGQRNRSRRRGLPDEASLERNAKRFEYIGQTTIGSGSEISVETARESLSLSLSEMDKGSFMIFQLPEFTAAAKGAEQSSLATLKGASRGLKCWQE